MSDTCLKQEIVGISGSDPEVSLMQDELLRVLVDNIPGAVLVTDQADERVLFANAECTRLWLPADVRSLAAYRQAMLQRAADPGLVVNLWTQRSEFPFSADAVGAELLLRDGRQLRWSTRLLADSQGRVQGVLHLFADITPPSLNVTTARVVDDLFRLTFEKAAVGMTLISSDFRFLRANPSFCRMTGFPERELLAQRVFDLNHPEEPLQHESWAKHLALGQDTFHEECRFLGKNASAVWVHLSVSVVRDADGRPTYFIAMAEDITQRKKQEREQQQRTQELLTLATTDPLTGLYNHRFMQEFLQQKMVEAKRNGQPVTVLMLDLDHFRDLNEEHGHDAGNIALRAVADCMRHSLREEDVACRYGGEEFVMILAGAPLAAALAAAERIRRRVEEVRPTAFLAQPVTCSIGVASYPDHASTPASLLKAADMALYEAKRSGRNRVCRFEPGRHASILDDLEQLASGLQGASLDAVNALVTAIDLRDRYTGAHCQRVGRLSVELAVRLGCAEDQLDILRIGSTLLDVGKIGLPDSILTKTSRLSRQEWELMRQHPVWGEQLVQSSALPPQVLELVRWHHERLDGSGYPDSAGGSDLPLLVRIVNVADVAAALRDDRPHRRAWPRARVLDYLQQQSGTKLDPDVVQAYVELYGTP